MFPKINQILFIQLNSIDEEEMKKQYKSRISDMKETYMTIEIPMNEKTGRLKKLFLGDELSIYFLTESGVKNYFSSKVVGFHKDVIKQVKIERPKPADIEKVQRRNFLRIPADLEISIKGNDLHFTTLTKDVSGGGISFICEGNIPVMQNEIYSIWLVIPYKNNTIEHVNFKGQVVRIKPLQTGRLLVMMTFNEILDRERQRIIRFCFEKEIEFRKK